MNSEGNLLGAGTIGIAHGGMVFQSCLHLLSPAAYVHDTQMHPISQIVCVLEWLI